MYSMICDSKMLKYIATCKVQTASMSPDMCFACLECVLDAWVYLWWASMYFWGYRQSLQSNSYSVTLFESTVGLCRLVVLEASSCAYVFRHVEALPMHSIVYAIVYYLWCRTEERGAWDACSYPDYLCILQCRRYVCRVRVILVLILKSVFSYTRQLSNY